MSVAHAIEHAEHISHAAHGDKLGTYIGITMAILGVLLAFCSAMVGSERTLLVQKLVEQQHAHAKYQAQDVKHRVSFMAVAQVHATAFGVPNPTVNKQTLLAMVQNVSRYLEESVLAKDWTNSFDGVIKAHMEAQEEYERGLLCAEIGIVIASIALLMKRREPWILSVLLALATIGIMGTTMVHMGHEVAEAQHEITTAENKYEEARKSHKTTKLETDFLESVASWAGGTAGAPVAEPAKAAAAASAPAAKAH